MSTSTHALPAVPRTQGLKSTTFCVPPLDGSLTFPQLFEFHGKHSPEHPFFVYAEEDGTTKTITWGRSVQAILRSALLIRERLGWKPNVGAEQTPVVAILSASGERLNAHVLGITDAHESS